ncbi:hypothetical protein BKA70DRAFT_1367253 [Coprinopsis sp. MPI-PUGE-AT-0042]|nr:hypothetical protein BKA70DRAFT_1367253 [Coprinopsis sp. MPI-PUGE-AT-0042]
MEPPTSVLPGIKKIPTTPHDELRRALNTCARSITLPNYAIRWLTSVVAYLSGKDTERLLADIAALLAICAGTASAGVISRIFTSHSPLLEVGEDEGTISINLRVTWGGACVMAEMLVEVPARFGLLPLWGATEDDEGEMKKRPFRILERGAGTGLVLLAIASHDRRHGKTDVEILATDYNPCVLDNLEVNLKSNGLGSAPDKTNASCSLDWSTFTSPASSPSSLSSSNDTLLDESLDMTFGADIIKGCLKKLLRRPLRTAGTTTDSTDEGGPRKRDGHNAYFHLIVPVRSTHTFESGTIATLFRSVLREGARREDGDADLDLVILEETIVCKVEEGTDEVDYAYYVIG